MLVASYIKYIVQCFLFGYFQVPIQNCQQVPKQNCVSVPRQQCTTTQKEVCEDLIFKDFPAGRPSKDLPRQAAGYAAPQQVIE